MKLTDKVPVRMVLEAFGIIGLFILIGFLPAIFPDVGWINTIFGNNRHVFVWLILILIYGIYELRKREKQKHLDNISNKGR